MRRIGYVLLLVCVAGCQSAAAKPGTYTSKIVQAATVEVTNAVLVKPDVQPNGKCAECNGTGILGDGTIKIKCPVCKGSGKSVVSLVSQPKRTFDCPADCKCVFCGCKNGQCGTVAKPAKVTTVASGSCANGRCNLPANTTKKTTVAAPRVTGSCSGGSCSSRGVFRGRLFGRR